LNIKILDSIEETVATLVHELDHHLSGYDDGSEAFRNVADMRIAKLMMSLYLVMGE
jgi:hypothetical protein